MLVVELTLDIRPALSYIHDLELKNMRQRVRLMFASNRARIHTQTNPGRVAARSASAAHDAWSFVYIFFTNGIPFDSPNRSEPCPREPR